MEVERPPQLQIQFVTMRELTQKEKELCKALIDKDRKEQHQLRIGDVLLDLYDFECIEKDVSGEKYQDCPFNIRIGCLSDKRKGIEEDMNEAIALLIMLKEKGMLSYCYSKSDECFGDNTPQLYYLEEPEHSEAAMLNYFNVNVWHLLDSYYYVSNSFVDYVNNDCKTIEQRRHEEEMSSMKCTNHISIATTVIAVLTLFVTICCSCSRSAKQNEIINYTETQYKSYEEIMADSIVSLSFKGITLGKPLSAALKREIENNHIWNVSRKGDETKGQTSILLLDSDKPLQVSIIISTIRDTVYSIDLKSKSDRAFDNIAKLYGEKYGRCTYYSYDTPDATYNPNNNEYYEWTFSNQRVEVTEKDYVMEIRDYMMKDKETLQMFLDCRDHSVYVHYTDFEFSEKARISDSIKREQEELYKAKKQHIQDSIIKIKESRRKDAALIQI